MNIRCTNYRAVNGTYIKGFAAIKFLDLGLEIRDVAVHSKDGHEFISMPAKQFFKNGEKVFYHTAVFPDIRDRRNFERIALEAINDFRSQGEGKRDATINGG